MLGRLYTGRHREVARYLCAIRGRKAYSGHPCQRHTLQFAPDYQEGLQLVRLTVENIVDAQIGITGRKYQQFTFVDAGIHDVDAWLLWQGFRERSHDLVNVGVKINNSAPVSRVGDANHAIALTDPHQPVDIDIGAGIDQLLGH